MESFNAHPLFLKELEQFFPANVAGAVNETNISSEIYLKHANFSTTTQFSDLLFDNTIVEPIGPKSLYVLPLDELNYVKEMYEAMLSGSELNVHHVSTLCYQFSRIRLGNHLLSSTIARSDRSSYIYAKWPGNSLNTDECNYRAGSIQFFLKQDVIIKKDEEEVLIQPTIALVQWYKIPPEKNYLLSPITLWSTDFEPLCSASFMPVNRTAARCAQTQLHFDFKDRPYNSGQTVVIIPIENTD